MVGWLLRNCILVESIQLPASDGLAGGSRSSLTRKRESSTACVSMCVLVEEREGPPSLSWGVMEECIIRGHHSSPVPTDTRVTYSTESWSPIEEGNSTTQQTSKRKKNEGTWSIVSEEKETEREEKKKNKIRDRNIVRQEIPEENPITIAKR